MKRVGGLFEIVADRKTIALAAWRAAQGKHGRLEVRQFLNQLDVEAGKIVHQLRDGTYRFGAYSTFSIRDPKTRLIHAPSFRDRVVHHAIVVATGPVFERGAIAHSYACRAGRGQHAALAVARRWIRQGDWFFKGDVAKFYDSVDHGRLKEQLARRFRERKLLNLFDQLLASYQSTPGKGLPIGALTSQYLGNFFLDPFDHWMNQSCGMHRYLRYMDDVLCFGTPEKLRAVRSAVAGVLEGMGLTLKQGGQMNQARLGAPFLGFVLYPDRLRLNLLGRRRLRRRLKDLERSWERGQVSDGDLQARSEALFAHTRAGDDLEWRRMVVRLSRFGETQGPQPRDTRRLVEQHRQEVPIGVSQQEEAG